MHIPTFFSIQHFNIVPLFGRISLGSSTTSSWLHNFLFFLRSFLFTGGKPTSWFSLPSPTKLRPTSLSPCFPKGKPNQWHFQPSSVLTHSNPLATLYLSMRCFPSWSFVFWWGSRVSQSPSPLISSYSERGVVDWHIITLNELLLNSNHDILLGWFPCTGASVAFSRVHPTAFAMYALKDFPRTTLVLAVDSSLVHDISLRL